MITNPDLRTESHSVGTNRDPVAFTDSYYQQVIETYGYDEFELDRFAFSLSGMSADELNLRWLCHHHADRFLDVDQSARIVTTGFGMSGIPHMGTIAQIIAITRIQQGGERTQIVLGDLDAHNGKGRPLAATRDLADQFSAFCHRLGYDSTAGVLRNQFDDIDSLRNLYLLGHYADDADFVDAEEDNHRYYADLGIVDDRMTYRRKMSLALMASDFLTLGQSAEAVLVMLGVDEHKYVRFATDIAERLNENTILRGAFILSAMYSRLTSGFNGHPKMSKSIPGSSLDVASTADEIRGRISADDVRAAEQSPSFQLISQLFTHSAEDCVRLSHECAQATQAWTDAKAELTDYLISITALW